jgi:ribosomal protein S18 acetylase RimI-like enzyme
VARHAYRLDVTAAIDTASRADLPAVASTLARAFADDPVFAVLFGEPVPLDRATRFFEIIGRIQLPHGLLFRTRGTEAAACWTPPGKWKMPNRTIVRHSPALLRVFGRRLLANLRIQDLLEQHHPAEPHYYLEFIGTDPAHQGKGFGSQLLTPMLERCDHEGVGAYLESSKEANVGFYRRFGFEVTETITHTAGPQQWLMWRDPR